MGWDRPNIYVECIKESSRGDKYSRLIMLPSNMFPNVEYWKPFLLGHAKYGPVSHWEPVKPIRGEPDNLSPSLESIFSDGVADSKLSRPLRATFSTITWYTLDELLDINLDKRMGLPENPTVNTRGITFEVKADEKSFTSGSLTNIIDNDVLNQSFNEEIGVNLNGNNNKLFKPENGEYGSIKEYIEHKWENKFEEDPPNKIKVEGKGREIKSWDNNFEEFLEFLEGVRINEDLYWMWNILDSEPPSKENIRIVIAV